MTRRHAASDIHWPLPGDMVLTVYDAGSYREIPKHVTPTHPVSKVIPRGLMATVIAQAFCPVTKNEWSCILVSETGQICWVRTTALGPVIDAREVQTRGPYR